MRKIVEFLMGANVCLAIINGYFWVEKGLHINLMVAAMNCMVAAYLFLFLSWSKED